MRLKLGPGPGKMPTASADQQATKQDAVDGKGGATGSVSLAWSAVSTRYAIDLRSMTGGRGRFRAIHSHYDPVPAHLVDRLCRAINDHDLDTLVDCFAADYVNETPVHPTRGFVGRAQVRRNWEQILAFVPEDQLERIIQRNVEVATTALQEAPISRSAREELTSLAQAVTERSA